MQKNRLTGWLATIVLTMFFGSFHLIHAGQNVVVVLDDSGSMQQPMKTENGRIPRIQAAKNALSKVVQGLNVDAQFGLLLLNNGGRGNNPWLVPLGPFSATAVLPKIAKIRADGGTPLGGQMKVAADALLGLRQKQIYGDYRLLVITDGEANDANLLEAYLPDILSRGLSLDVIGVDMSANHSLADRAHSYRRADDVQSFEKAVQEVFAESSNQTDQQGENDFELIADLPDEFAREALAAIAVPHNDVISYAANPTVTSGNPNLSAPPTSMPGPSSPSPATAIDGIVGILSALPCCFTIVIVMVLVLALGQKKKRR